MARYEFLTNRRAGDGILISRSEALAAIPLLQEAADQALDEFRVFYNAPVSIDFEIKRSDLGFWVESRLLFDGSVVRDYPMASLVFLDLDAFMMKRLRELNMEEVKT